MEAEIDKIDFHYALPAGKNRTGSGFVDLLAGNVTCLILGVRKPLKNCIEFDPGF